MVLHLCSTNVYYKYSIFRNYTHCCITTRPHLYINLNLAGIELTVLRYTGCLTQAPSQHRSSPFFHTHEYFTFKIYNNYSLIGPVITNDCKYSILIQFQPVTESHY